jgi:hypothetical protein
VPKLFGKKQQRGKQKPCAVNWRTGVAATDNEFFDRIEEAKVKQLAERPDLSHGMKLSGFEGKRLFTNRLRNGLKKRLRRE